MLVAALALAPGAGVFEVVALGMLVTAVVLHELGHSLVARRFGIRVIDITLWPLGGMARLSHVPESSRVEAWIAVAGPAVNVALAIVGVPLWIAALALLPAGSEWIRIAATFVVIHVLMAGFNLLPAFPTDGGRLVRAWLARRRNWLGATEGAVRIGRFVALLIAVAGVIIGNWMLPVVALWLWWAGSQELAQVRARHTPGVAVPVHGYTDQEIARIEAYRGRLRGL